MPVRAQEAAINQRRDS